MVEFVTRKEWGARPPDPGPGHLDRSQVEGIALHWPAAIDHDPGVPDFNSIKEVSAALRGWQNFHMDTNGWSDIAYQGAVDMAGNYYRLRGLRTQSAANGDQDVNERFGALLLVIAIGEKPTPAMIKTVQNRVAKHRNIFPKSHRIVPHSQIRPEPTACPGDIVRGMINKGVFEPPKRKR